ncbi:MAG: hypothetical protein M1605_03895 [Candidatus Thermoplasmatota archaeon]|nr:hypothetical protein [Candidatus Thermoplasmatota archaeon]
MKMENHLLMRLRKETEYLRRRQEALEKEIGELQETIEHNSKILEETIRDLHESEVIIETMRKLNA